MASSDHTAGLSSDIQRALQLAVGEVNHPFIQSQTKKTSRKKRHRNDDARDDEKQAKKTKKRVDKSIDTGAHSDPAHQSMHQQPLQSDSPAQVQTAEEVPTESADSPSQVLSSGLQQDLSGDNHHASSAAFLNAVVAAASATSSASQPMDMPPYPHHPPYQEHHPMIPDQQTPYLPYPPVHYGYEDPQFGHPPPPPQPQPLFPGVGGAMPDFSFTSNDDILRAIQDMDMSKIASVFKSLGDAAAAAANGSAGNPLPPGFMPPVPPNGEAALRPQSVMNMPSTSSGSALSTAPKSTKSSHKRVLDMSLPGPEPSNPEHAHMLANKWMNASKLAELVKTEGLVYKKGKFSAIEEQQLKTAIENFRTTRGFSDDQILEIIFQKNEKGKDNTFWSEITAAVPQRPIIAVYHHVRRTFHPKKQQGKWTVEEDNLLKQAVTDLGQQWEKVSERVGRMSSDCRDRYRNHIANRELRVTGPWSKEEEEELTRIVTEMTVQQGKDFDNDVFWGIVSARMGNRRGRQQCRIKWTDSLSKTVKNEGQKPRWSPQDAYILVHKVDSLKVRDDTEIDWKTLPDADWNLWSAHSLQRRWLTMKRSIKGYEDMTHQEAWLIFCAEIMDILRVKKAHLHPPTASIRRRKVTSAASVDDNESVVDPELAKASSSVLEAGPSGSDNACVAGCAD
ncbi:hypothetical protein ID866_2551 [Astraeus odoratus]|nr:hypothetical protein ID866_2551 [Astraeus odoratus]